MEANQYGIYRSLDNFYDKKFSSGKISRQKKWVCVSKIIRECDNTIFWGLGQ